MYYAKKNKLKLLILLLVIFSTRCVQLTDDLFPSSEDKSSEVTEKLSVGDLLPATTIVDMDDKQVDLVSLAQSSGGLVMYFTMWCSVCNSHIDHILNDIKPLYLGMKYIVIDYVSGSSFVSRQLAAASGYYFADLTILVDLDHTLLNMFQATMGTTIIVDSQGKILFIENYKGGNRLKTVLGEL